MEAAVSGATRTAIQANTSGTNMETDGLNEVGSVLETSINDHSVDNFEMGVPQSLISSMDISSPISFTERFLFEDLTEDLDASTEGPGGVVLEAGAELA